MEVSRVLEAARGLGFFGPQPVVVQVEHALGFAEVLASHRALTGSSGVSARGLDLGSGGGLPGLVLAEVMPDVSWTLLDAMERRMAFVAEELLRLGWPTSRCRAVRCRAEAFAELPMERASYELIAARGFGPPSDVAECAAGLLVPGGVLVVSEPPDSDGSRWSIEGLRQLGFGTVSTVVQRGYSFVVVSRVGAVPPWCPRSAAKRARRPWNLMPPAGPQQNVSRGTRSAEQ
jgi:16S rRNA (guanine527-N7)-methyltransferase